VISDRGIGGETVTTGRDVFAEACGRQYLAGLTMLRNAIEACPDDVWAHHDGTEAPFWQHTMHALYYTRLFLQPSPVHPDATDNAESAMAQIGAPMKDWSQDEIQRMNDTMGVLCDKRIHPPRTVTRAEMLQRLGAAAQACATAFAEVGEVGAAGANPMPWLTGTRADLLVYNLRHLQHHIGRLHSILGRRGQRLEWVGGLP
jgi:hypothetical protein